MPVSKPSVMGLNAIAKKSEARFLSQNPSLKETLTK